MKRCCTCHVVKSLDAFHRRTSARDGRQGRCKECFAEQYRREGDVLRERVQRRYKPLRAEKIKLMAEYLAEHRCVDCGEDDLRVLDFDHRDGVLKRSAIAQMLFGGWTWATILEEIAKCDVRCANCHRRRTAESQGWWKQEVQMASAAQVREMSTARLQRLRLGGAG